LSRNVIYLKFSCLNFQHDHATENFKLHGDDPATRRISVVLRPQSTNESAAILKSNEKFQPGEQTPQPLEQIHCPLPKTNGNIFAPF